jgi:hypothetical protein
MKFLLIMIFYFMCIARILVHEIKYVWAFLSILLSCLHFNFFNPFKPLRTILVLWLSTDTKMKMFPMLFGVNHGSKVVAHNLLQNYIFFIKKCEPWVEIYEGPKHVFPCIRIATMYFGCQYVADKSWLYCTHYLGLTYNMRRLPLATTGCKVVSCPCTLLLCRAPAFFLFCFRGSSFLERTTFWRSVV